MIIDITGTVLTPGNGGRDCLGNGQHMDMLGNPVECCCDECDYMLCCLETHNSDACKTCGDFQCPNARNNFDICE